MNANATRIANVSAAKLGNGERELLRLVEAQVMLDVSFGVDAEQCQTFDYLRAYHGMSIGEAIREARIDVRLMAERNANTDLESAAAAEFARWY